MALIVVGVDGSENARRALAWAVAHAASRGDTLRVIHAWMYPGVDFPLNRAVETPDVDTLLRGAEQLLANEIAAVAVPYDVTIDLEVRRGKAAEVLVNESSEADLVVIGSRGVGGFSGLLVGSVGNQVVHHALCPVVIIPPSERTGAVS